MPFGDLMSGLMADIASETDMEGVGKHFLR